MLTNRLLRAGDIIRRRIANNRNHLQNLIKDHGFPQGRRMPGGRGIRTWTEEEVEAWYEALPRPKDSIGQVRTGTILREVM
jgi:predicted DNA-binding transcriptional regulator AlpA